MPTDPKSPPDADLLFKPTLGDNRVEAELRNTTEAARVEAEFRNATEAARAEARLVAGLVRKDPSLWGRDHVTTFAYLETRAVEANGRVQAAKMRSHASGYPTRLKDGRLLPEHDDFSCLEDFIEQKLMAYQPDTDWPEDPCPPIQLSTLGWEVASLMRSHRAVFGSKASQTFDFAKAIAVSKERVRRLSAPQPLPPAEIAFELAMLRPDPSTGSPRTAVDSAEKAKAASTMLSLNCEEDTPAQALPAGLVITAVQRKPVEPVDIATIKRVGGPNSRFETTIPLAAEQPRFKQLAHARDYLKKHGFRRVKGDATTPGVVEQWERKP